MQDSPKIPNADAFFRIPFPLAAIAVMEEKTDPEINDQLAKLIKTYGPDSEIVKPLAALKATKDDEVREELIQLLKVSGEKKMPLMMLEEDHICFLAAKSKVGDRGVMKWRKRRIVEMAEKGLVTDADIERETFIEGLALDQLTAKLIKDGKLARDGAGYRVPDKSSDKS